MNPVYNTFVTDSTTVTVQEVSTKKPSINSCQPVTVKNISDVVPKNAAAPMAWDTGTCDKIIFVIIHIRMLLCKIFSLMKNVVLETIKQSLHWFF